MLLEAHSHLIIFVVGCADLTGGKVLFVWLLLFYAVATVFQLCHSGDMMYEMRRRKPKPKLFLTQGIFNLPRLIVMVSEELAFDDAVSYTQRGNGLQHSEM